MRLKLKEDPREWRKFAWALCGVIFALTVWGVWRGRLGLEPGVALGLLAVGLAAVGTFRPGSFRRTYRIAMTGAHHVGQVMGRVLLCLIFVLGVVPLGLFLRLLRRDLLGLRRPSAVRSFWRDARPPGPLDRLS